MIGASLRNHKSDIRVWKPQSWWSGWGDRLNFKCGFLTDIEFRISKNDNALGGKSVLKGMATWSLDFYA